MRLIALIFALLIYCLPANAQISLVTGQVADANSFSSITSISAALPNNPGAGHIVVACGMINDGGAHTPITVKDGDNNSYTLTTSSPLVYTQTGNTFNLVLAYLQNTPSPVTNSKTVTMTWTTAVAGSHIWVAEFQGAATSSAFVSDVTATGGGPGTTINTPSITTAANGDLLHNCVTGQGAGTFAVGSPWTLINGGIYNNAGGSAYYVQPTAGAQAVNYTQGSGNWAGIIAAFKAPAAGVTCGARALVGAGC